jgi:hypothetical protein
MQTMFSIQTHSQDQIPAVMPFYRYIVLNSVVAVRTIARSKSKLNKADILVWFSIIKCCDADDDSLTAEVAKFQGTFRLTRKEMKGVLLLCLELLDDEEALSVAELDLLDMLAYIAGSRGYIAYLTSQNDMQLILKEVEIRISDESLPHALRQKAAVIFHNLCSSTSGLGMDMTFLVAGCLKIIAQCCAEAYRNAQAASDASSFAELSSLIGGLTIILRQHTEQAIAPLTRHGRPILRLVKSRYRKIPDRGQRHVLNQYFLCHL